MARLDNLRRIMSEDFPKESRKTIEMLGETLNAFMGDVIDVVNGKINFDNINQEITTFRVFTDVNGSIITAGGTSSSLNVKLGRSSKVSGVLAIRSKNITDSTNYPSANPYISFSAVNQILNINKITGLQAVEQYEITILIVYAE